MRIVSGSLRGRVLKIDRNLSVRPTTDMAREALFNILNSNFYFDEMDVLDLFSGTGAMSIEFISRGAVQVISVDNNPASIEGIKKNCETFGVENLQAFRTDAFRFLTTTRKKFDIIFADPPFELEQADYEKLYQTAVDNELFKDGAWFILEHNKLKNFDHLPHYMSTRKYGKVHFSIFEFSEEVEEESK